MVWARSVLFSIVFYVVIVVYMILALPTLLLPRGVFLAILKHWSRLNLTLLRVICGLKCEFRGLDKIPQGAVLVASKHQSMWETFALITVLKDPAYILKRELMWIPLFGWHAWKSRQIPVDRGARVKALASMTARAKEEVAAGRQIVIFPEGTRRAPGAAPSYKFGVAFLYNALDIPCMPVALNSGVYWPRRSVMRYPGTIVVEFLDPIPPGLDRQTFFDRLQTEIETATQALVGADHAAAARNADKD